MSRKNFRKLTPGRMYEITAVSDDHIWGSRKYGSTSPLLGAVVTNATPEREFSSLRVHKQGPKKVYVADPHVQLSGLTFRPLSIKDQKKIEEANRGS